MQITSVVVLALIDSAIAQSLSSNLASTSVAISSPVKTIATNTVKTNVAKATGGVRHIVQVGSASGALTFTPNVVTAAVGHMVEFVFNPKNHSVAQAAFDSPCVPLDQSASMAGMTGFYSGFHPVENTTSSSSTTAPATTKTERFAIMVNSTAPMWFYCSQMMHCQSGMVGVINPTNTSGQTLESFMAGAKKAAKNISPAKVAGGCDSSMKSNTSASTAPHKSGIAQSTGMTRTNMTTNATLMANAAAAVKTVAAPTAAAASVSAAAASSTGIKQSSDATRTRSLLEAGSSLGLLFCLATTIVLFA